jgi:hypothetical protein
MKSYDWHSQHKNNGKKKMNKFNLNIDCWSLRPLIFYLSLKQITYSLVF